MYKNDLKNIEYFYNFVMKKAFLSMKQNPDNIKEA